MKQEIGGDRSTNKTEDDNKIEDSLKEERWPWKKKTISEKEDNLKKWVGYEWLIINPLI